MAFSPQRSFFSLLPFAVAFSYDDASSFRVSGDPYFPPAFKEDMSEEYAYKR